MELLNKYFVQLKGYFIKKSLHRALAVYILSAVLVVLLLNYGTINFCMSWRNLIGYKYKIQLGEDYVTPFTLAQGEEKEAQTGSYIVYNYMTEDMEKSDVILESILSSIEGYGVIFYTVIAVIITSKQFYRVRLKKPLEILTTQAAFISRNELQHECYYHSEDEMGYICKSFDQMRLKVVDNQKVLWGIMEEQRSLNAAFAHDLRTPLTVLHGYLDLLQKYFPEGKISEEKLMDTLVTMDRQIDRLIKFSGTMKEINRIEEIQVVRKKEVVSDIIQGLKGTMTALEQIHPLSISLDYKITSKGSQKMINIDRNILEEVLDNLLSNAVRFAKGRIEITLKIEDETLELYVKDDGRGFTKEELHMAEKPYYSGSKDKAGQFGIGLTICKILCEKHGGSLSFYNSIDGGALILADFYL